MANLEVLQSVYKRNGNKECEILHFMNLVEQRELAVITPTTSYII